MLTSQTRTLIQHSNICCASFPACIRCASLRLILKRREWARPPNGSRYLLASPNWPPAEQLSVTVVSERTDLNAQRNSSENFLSSNVDSSGRTPSLFKTVGPRFKETT